MTDLLRLLTLLAEKRTPRQKPGFFARIGFSAIAGFFLLWALFCALIALWIYVIPFVGPAGAPLVVGGVLLLIGLIFLLLARKRPVAAVPQPARVAQQNAVEAENLFKQHKGALLLALFTAAFQSGVSRR